MELFNQTNEGRISFMKHWKIGTRMKAGFGALIVVTLALGAFAYSRTVSMNRAANLIVVDSWPGVVITLQIQGVVKQNESALLRRLLAKTETEKTEAESYQAEVRRRVTELFNAYEKTITTSRDRELFEAMKTARSTFLGGYDEVLRLCQSSKTDEALKVYRTRVSAELKQYIEAVDAEVTFNKDNGDKYTQAILEAGAAALIGIPIGIGMAALLGIVTSLVITRSIVRPLAVANNLIATVSQGDLRK
jgi:methyl-accepting chemotaxis protein